MLARRHLLQSALAPLLAAQPKRPVRLILDTDIGNDVDDAMTLILLLNSPEVELAAVTTVDRNTRRRAQSALRLMAAMGRTAIPCAAGCSVPISRPPTLRGWSDRAAQFDISSGGPDPDRAALDAQHPSPLHAVDLILQQTAATGGPGRLLLAGQQTNLAVALLKDPSLADRLEEVTVMGFNFQTGIDPYNVGGDLAAARLVLASGIPLTVLPVEIGIACQMTEAEYAACLAATCPQGRILSAAMRRWVAFVRHRPSNPLPTYCPRPYDSLAAMTLTHPQVFEFQRGTIRLDSGDVPTQSRATFEKSVTGIHRVVTAVDRDKAMRIHQERLLACADGR